MMNGKFFVTLIAFVMHSLAFGQLITNSSLSPQGLVQNVLLGSGVTVSNVMYNGSPGAIGQFTANNTTLGITQGIVMTTGTVQATSSGPQGPNNQSNAGMDNNAPGSTLLTNQVLGGTQTFNAAILEFDFIPYADTVRFKYVFGSDEYPEFAPPNNSGYNDVFGFFISGPGIVGMQNIARLPNGGGIVSINNVNAITNQQFFTFNGDGNSPPYDSNPQYIQYDGFTKVLEAVSKVQCGQTYHLIIAIADAGDGQWDSGMFLEANSLSTKTPIEIEYTLSQQVYTNPDWLAEGCVSAAVTLTRQNNTASSLTIPVQVSGTATNGQDYTGVPTSITFNAGQTTTTFTLNALFDNLTEGLENVVLTFPISDPCGNVTPLVVTLYIQDVPPLVVTINGATIACPGDPINLTTNVSGGVTPYQFTWSTGETTSSINFTPTSTQTINVQVSDACSSSPTSASIIVNVPQYPPITISVSNDLTEICPYLPQDFGVIPSGGTGAYNYQWTANGIPFNWTDSISVSPGITTNYIINVNDNCGNVAIDSILYTITSPPLTVQMNGPIQICPGDSAFLQVTASGGFGNYYYLWTQTNQTTNGIWVNPNATTSYFVQVSDECQTFYVTGVALVQVVKPTSDFWIMTHYPTEGLMTSFLNQSQNAWAYVWNFGDGSANSFLVNPTHIYDDPGDYLVTLVAVNQKGCVDSVSKWIQVIPERYIYFPNSFTPDNDACNEFFFGDFIGILGGHFYLYNRWGECIFESTDLNFKWNGTYQGVPVQIGTYSWYFVYEIGKGIFEDLSGHVNVIR
jgi:gliding motility-associated-like protein